MKFFVPVLDYPSGKPLIAPLEEDEFLELVLKEVGDNLEPFRSDVRLGSKAIRNRGEVKRAIKDSGDPHQAGWTYVIHVDDPQRHEIIEALVPLAAHRGMAKPHEPMLFDGRDQIEWNDWLEDAYPTLEGKQRPFYILLAGSPQWLPFGLQSYLDVSSAVGRLDFDDIEDYENYVAKVIQRDALSAQLSDRQALVFATDGGPIDPTYYSRKFMAKPLAEFMQEKGFTTQTLFGDEASKAHLSAVLRGSRPAIVYTASHGFAAFGQPDDVQRRINGAIECQPGHHPASADDFLFGAANVPSDESFLEGSVFFQFACFGYGTPATSHFAHWFPEVALRNSGGDFVAAFPKRLLSHPTGPVAYIGHLDLAFMHGFTDQDAPDIQKPWHTRLEPFASAVDALLSTQPVGLALELMNTRSAHLSSVIVNRYDLMMRHSNTDTPEYRMKLARTFVQLNDSRNYMVFGDPAVRLRIGDT